MKTRDRYLSGLLLILIGILIGTLIAFYQQTEAVDVRADVKVTEVRHSSRPVFSDEQLEKLDARFLFKNVAESVTPTVVYIETVVPLSGSDIPDDEFHDRENDFWGDIIPRRAHTVGSGIIISSDGYILTNNHVIQGAIENEIEVVLNDKRTYKARKVGKDPTTDLAVIKIDDANLPAITFGDSDNVQVGEWVLAIGNPFRLRSTVTAGIISALSRDVQIINDQMRVESFIQTDAAINKGNSGGALVNTSGELVGVNTAIASQSGSYQGYGFAVPSNLASKVAEDIIQYGKVRRALLGVTIVSVDSDIAAKLEMDEIRGVQITNITNGGAADKSGLQRNDIILSVNGSIVNESNQLQQKIAVLHPGDTVELKLLRNGKEMVKSVKLGMLTSGREQLTLSKTEPKELQDQEPEELEPSEQDVSFATFSLGFRVMAVSRENGRYELVITQIETDSEAERSGLQEGYSIIKVGNRRVEDLNTLNDLIAQNLKKRNSVTLEVETQEGNVKHFELEQ